MELSEIRKQIDKIDKKLVELIKQRLDLIPEVAQYKLKNNIKRFQKKREAQIISRNRKRAKELKINPDLIEDILKRMIKESHRVEKKIMKK
ncbi:MAG: hypothetical protein GF335_03510 [Candidatus Moranbacteria bacterium]|nr:hypothetical protein [Candidatus Moranbacteria bacterium]